MDSQEPEPRTLRESAETALQRALDAGDVLPLLHRLARTAPAGSEESIFAHRQLAELVADRHPWRAALYARRVLEHRPEDDRAWAVLALCQTMLGNYRSAVAAYRRALTAAPKNPWYAHNLGHLIDVALGRPEEALPWLRTAHAAASRSAEVVVSLAHAQARAGHIEEAKRLVSRASRGKPSREQAAMMQWLEQGAPVDQDFAPWLGTPRTSRGAAARFEGEGKAPGRASRSRLHAALARGMAHLPLDAQQRAHALALASDAVQRRAACPARDEVPTFAAAVAYAIVWVDRVPLTQAEVAACFRVSVSAVRGRFGELRASLSLAPGDIRYRSVRAH